MNRSQLKLTHEKFEHFLRGSSLRFLVAPATVGIGVALWLSLSGYLSSEASMLLLLVSVFWSAWLIGFWTGMVAAVLSVFAADYFFPEAANSFGFDRFGEQLNVLIFIFSASVISFFIDRMRRSEKKLKETSVFLSSSHDEAIDVFEKMGDGFIQLDRDFRVVRVNSRLEGISGIGREKALGKTHWELWPDTSNKNSKFWLEYNRVMNTRQPAKFEAYYGPGDTWSEIEAYPTQSGGIAWNEPR